MFHPDSFLIRFLTKVCDLLFLNIVFVLSCATIVCSGAAVTSLYAVTLRMIRGQDYAPMRGFFRGLRENFLPSYYNKIYGKRHGSQPCLFPHCCQSC